MSLIRNFPPWGRSFAIYLPSTIYRQSSLLPTGLATSPSLCQSSFSCLGSRFFDNYFHVPQATGWVDEVSFLNDFSRGEQWLRPLALETKCVSSHLSCIIIQLSNLGKLLLSFIFLVCKVERIIIGMLDLSVWIHAECLLQYWRMVSTQTLTPINSVILPWPHTHVVHLQRSSPSGCR